MKLPPFSIQNLNYVTFYIENIREKEDTDSTESGSRTLRHAISVPQSDHRESKFGLRHAIRILRKLKEPYSTSTAV